MEDGDDEVLESLARDYLHLHPECKNPVRVYDHCGDYSEDWRDLLLRAGFDARLIYGLRMGEFMGRPVVTGAHIAVEVNGQVYDWTARQFDPKADVPLVISVAEFRAEWPLGEALSKEKEEN